MKGGVEFDPVKVRVENMPQYCQLCAWSLAFAHAKSGDAAMLAGYVGNSEELDDALVKFSFNDAKQNEKDFNALADAAKKGKIQLGRAAD
jgi:hypothetical protein